VPGCRVGRVAGAAAPRLRGPAAPLRPRPPAARGALTRARVAGARAGGRAGGHVGRGAGRAAVDVVRAPGRPAVRDWPLWRICARVVLRGAWQLAAPGARPAPRPACALRLALHARRPDATLSCCACAHGCLYPCWCGASSDFECPCCDAGLLSCVRPQHASQCVQRETSKGVVAGESISPYAAMHAGTFAV